MPSLILTSDDFGLSKIFNQRMIELLQSNFLSSISIMINQVTSDQQNQIAEIKKMYAKNNFSLGLHLEVSEADDEATYQSQWIFPTQIFQVGLVLINRNVCLFCFRSYIKVFLVRNYQSSLL